MRLRRLHAFVPLFPRLTCLFFIWRSVNLTVPPPWYRAFALQVFACLNADMISCPSGVSSARFAAIQLATSRKLSRVKSLRRDQMPFRAHVAETWCIHGATLH